MAASLSGPLHSMGPIRNKGQQLLITNTAIGSFGFELQEVPQSGLLLSETPVSVALEHVKTLLNSTIGTDDELAESAADTNPRALDKMRGFLQTVADYEATFCLSFRESEFRLSSVEDVRLSLERLGTDNLQEDEVTLTGQFEGFVPSRRIFDFAVADGELITGRTAAVFPEPYVTEINKHLRETLDIRVMRTRVRGGKPRYRLLDVPRWLPLLG